MNFCKSVIFVQTSTDLATLALAGQIRSVGLEVISMEGSIMDAVQLHLKDQLSGGFLVLFGAPSKTVLDWIRPWGVLRDRIKGVISTDRPGWFGVLAHAFDPAMAAHGSYDDNPHGYGSQFAEGNETFAGLRLNVEPCYDPAMVHIGGENIVPIKLTEYLDTISVRSEAEIHALIENWKKSPIWDLEDTAGFGRYRERLKAVSEAFWAQAEGRQRERLAADLTANQERQNQRMRDLGIVPQNKQERENYVKLLTLISALEDRVSRIMERE